MGLASQSQTDRQHGGGEDSGNLPTLARNTEAHAEQVDENSERFDEGMGRRAE